MTYYRPVIELDSHDLPKDGWIRAGPNGTMNPCPHPTLNSVTLAYRNDETGEYLKDCHGIEVHSHYESLSEALRDNPQIKWRDPGESFPKYIVKVGKM